MYFPSFTSSPICLSLPSSINASRYVERTKFLERVDHRQFELEKAVRLTNMKQWLLIVFLFLYLGLCLSESMSVNYIQLTLNSLKLQSLKWWSLVNWLNGLIAFYCTFPLAQHLESDKYRKQDNNRKHENCASWVLYIFRSGKPWKFKWFILNLKKKFPTLLPPRYFSKIKNDVRFTLLKIQMQPVDLMFDAMPGNQLQPSKKRFGSASSPGVLLGWS